MMNSPVNETHVLYGQMGFEILRAALKVCNARRSAVAQWRQQSRLAMLAMSAELAQVIRTLYACT